MQDVAQTTFVRVKTDKCNCLNSYVGLRGSAPSGASIATPAALLRELCLDLTLDIVTIGMPNPYDSAVCINQECSRYTQNTQRIWCNGGDSRRITRLVEFWPEPYPAPPNRAHLVEVMP
jgi:hypothetical protein